MLLDWSMDHCPQDFTRFEQQLTAWLTFCRDELAHACPDGLRLVSYLAVERPAEQAAALQHILDSLEERFLGDWKFAFEALPPLEKVTVKDLVRYLSDRHHCNCPDAMRVRLPRLIYRETGGEFDRTVQLLQDGAKGHWHDLYDRLKQKWGKQCGIPDTED